MSKGKVILLIVVILTFATAGVFLWQRHQPKHPIRVNTSEYETDMIEGLVRGILQEPGMRQMPVCFLSFGDTLTPPKLNFIKRFSGSHPVVKAYGASMATPGGFFEPNTGHQGVLIQIIGFKEYISLHYDVEVSFAHLPSSHKLFTYRVENTVGDWVVESCKPE
jgi:hypothetical protein